MGSAKGLRKRVGLSFPKIKNIRGNILRKLASDQEGQPFLLCFTLLMFTFPVDL